MLTFKEFLIQEAPLGGPGGAPGMPPAGGMMLPTGMPPMGGGGLGMGMGGPMGGLGGPMGDPMMGGGQPQSQVVKLQPLNVWDVLEKIVNNKPIEDKKPSGSQDNNMINNQAPMQHLQGLPT